MRITSKSFLLSDMCRISNALVPRAAGPAQKEVPQIDFMVRRLAGAMTKGAKNNAAHGKVENRRGLIRNINLRRARKALARDRNTFDTKIGMLFGE